MTSPNPTVYLDITIAGRATGRIEILLRADAAPRTAENFLQLCKGTAPDGEGKVLGYEGCGFHRVVPGFVCHGGDILRGNGTGGRSIYGDTFPDENFTLKHDGPGVVSMSNTGPNTNSSQFFLCTAKCGWLDGRHVAFGRVVKGMEVAMAMEQVGSESGRTRVPVLIASCGQLS